MEIHGEQDRGLLHLLQLQQLAGVPSLHLRCKRVPVAPSNGTGRPVASGLRGTSGLPLQQGRIHPDQLAVVRLFRHLPDMPFLFQHVQGHGQNAPFPQA